MNLQKEKWERMQQEDYHNTQERINERVKETFGHDICVFDDFVRFFGRKFPLQDRVVLEIGFGGGWWLVTPIKRGAHAVGFEISREIIRRAEAAFRQLELTNYEFHEADERCLSVLQPSSVDYIFEITVFQHIDPEVTRKYLETSYQALKQNGAVVLQFLMDDKNPYKDPYEGEGTVFYTSHEVYEMVLQSNFIIEKIYKSWKDGECYWNHYLLRKPKSTLDLLRLKMAKFLCDIRKPFLYKKRKMARPDISGKHFVVHGSPLARLVDA